MAKLIKETTFFGGNRRKCELEHWEVLPGRGDGEKRIKMDVRMPLSDESLVAMPDWIGNTFEATIKDDSAQRRGILDRFMEGMTIEVFSTEKNRSRALCLTSTTVKNLCIERAGEEDESDVFLHFVVYSPANVQARDWAWDLVGKTFWASFEYSQTEMDFNGTADADEDPDNKNTMAPNKNTMAPERDAEFATPGTRKNRKPAAEAAVQ
jgi:hypothetical protein